MIERLMWCDGELVAAGAARVSALDRTLLYGLGAFETVRLYGARTFLVERHLARLRTSLEALRLPVPAPVAALPAGLEELARRLGRPSCLARVTVTAGAEGCPDGPCGPRVLAHLRELPVLPPPGQVRVGVAPAYHEPSSPVAGIKSTNYLVHYLLREQAEAAGRVDDLLVDHEGRVQEATIANVFFVRDGLLVTPPVTEGILPGVTRGLVLELARELGLPVAERHVDRGELPAMDECFLTGTGKGVLPVDELDGRHMPVRRPRASALGAAYAARVAAVCGVAVASVPG